jgi:hypothetical protein
MVAQFHKSRILKDAFRGSCRDYPTSTSSIAEINVRYAHESFNRVSQVMPPMTPALSKSRGCLCLTQKRRVMRSFYFATPKWPGQSRSMPMPWDGVERQRQPDAAYIQNLGNEKAYDSDHFIGSGTFRFCVKLGGERGFRPVRCRLCSLVCNKIRDEKLDRM